MKYIQGNHDHVFHPYKYVDTTKEIKNHDELKF